MLKKIILVFVAILLVMGALLVAQFFVSPGLMPALLSKITGGDFKKLTIDLGGLANIAGGNYPESSEYLVKQKYEIPVSFDVPYGLFSAKSIIHNVTVGFPMSKASLGNYGWQTDWKIISDVNSSGKTKSKADLPGGIKSTALTSDGYNSAFQTVYYFSLKGVKEGETFPIRYTQTELQKATYKFNESQWVFYGKDGGKFTVPIDTSEKTTDVPFEEKTATMNAILVKNNKENGAIVGFPPAELTRDQKAQLEQINQLVNSYGNNAAFQGFWNSQVYPKFTNLPQVPPLFIILKSDIPEPGYVQGEVNNKEYWDTGKGTEGKDVNPFDKNGDGVPDLVPLPGAKP